MDGHIVYYLVSLQELRLCQWQLKNTQKQIPNFSFPVQFYWITPFCSKYFVQDCKSSFFLCRHSGLPIDEYNMKMIAGNKYFLRRLWFLWMKNHFENTGSKKSYKEYCWEKMNNLERFYVCFFENLNYDTQFFLALYFRDICKLFLKQSDRILSKYVNTHMSRCISTLRW